MKQEIFADELNRRIVQLLARVNVEHEPEWNPLLAIAAEATTLPNPEFRSRLKADLLEEAESSQTHYQDAQFRQAEGAELLARGLPTLDGKQSGIFPADHRSFLVSFASHAVLVLLIASGIFVGVGPVLKKPPLTSELMFPADGHGGGGSGDRSVVPATKGTPPKFSDQQITPPAIVVHNLDPKLAVQPTVVGPPDVKLPQSNQIGDLISSNIVLPSNGSGTWGGAGSGLGTGLGGVTGIGIGPGSDRGTGGSAFTPSHGITPPRTIYDPEPEYSEEARKLKQQGIVVLSLVVDPQGRARDIHLVRSLGMGLDERAIEAVKKWKFEPGKKDGLPVAVQVNVEVNFRLF
jgi:TonB family protein